MNIRIPIDEADDDQLRGFASDFLQLDLPKTATGRVALLAEIGKAWSQSHIFTSEPLELTGDQIVTPEPVAAPVVNSKRYQNDPVVELEVMTTGYPGGKDPASVSVNGSANLVIQRGKRVSLPYRFYLALLDAHEVQTTQDSDTKQFVETRIATYPLTNLKMPPQPEIDAWHERTKDLVLG